MEIEESIKQGRTDPAIKDHPGNRSFWVNQRRIDNKYNINIGNIGNQGNNIGNQGNQENQENQEN